MNKQINNMTLLTNDLNENISTLREQFQNSSDFIARSIIINNVNVSFLMIEGMVNMGTMSTIMLRPLLEKQFNKKGSKSEIYEYIQSRSILAPDMKDVYTCEEVFQFLMSGFVVILIDGIDKAIVFGIQGFNFRSISEPNSEVNELGSREGFTEPLRINMTMVRRRIKSPLLKFDLMTIGETSKTDICLMYLTNKVSPELLIEIKQRLQNIKLDIILTSGYLNPFLEGKPWSLFSDVGITERPDVLAGKINEGRVAIIIDGTPYSLIVPYLFSENFQNLDDYAHRSYYASFIRFIKYISFLITILLPSLYVGICTFHPELLPHALIFNISAGEETTPFPLLAEALIMHLFYEIMREAGLRLPRSIGHAISIVGGLVIGDAAVSAGLIGAPMLLIVGLTAISAFVVPSLYEAVTILRFLFIILAGTLGLYGLALGIILMLVSMCSLENMGSIYMSPISPFSFSAMRDTFVRVNFRKMQNHQSNVNDLKGMKITDKY